MDELIKRAESLYAAIKIMEKKIDNPVLVTSTLNAIEFFVENIEDTNE